MATARWLVVTARWFCGRQVLLRLRGYISVWPTLQLSHNDVPGVGLGGCWNRWSRVIPSLNTVFLQEFFTRASYRCQAQYRTTTLKVIHTSDLYNTNTLRKLLDIQWGRMQ